MYIIFDIGGTKTRVAGSHDLVTYGEPVKFNTPGSYSEGMEELCKVIEVVSKGEEIQGIAGGIRGRLNKGKTGITGDAVLFDWANKEITTVLEDRFSTKAYLENDSAAVGLGEAVYGAGRGHSIVAYHTVSTGVGGARYVDGVLDVTSIGFEPGHQILDLDRTVLGEEIFPSLENLVSGSALEKSRGCKPYEIPQSDPVWDKLAYYLAVGLRNTVLYWSPDAIVLGGSMIVGDPRIYREDIIKHLEALLDGFVPCPIILDATLKDEGGLYGAMAMLLKRQ